MVIARMKNKLGFTFVEVIIAMAIFAILIVGVFPAFLIGVKLNAISKVSVETSTVAQTTMEQIYDYSINNTLSTTITSMTTSGTPPFTNQGTINKVTTLNKNDSTYTIVVVFTQDSLTTGLTRCKVTVTKHDNPYGASPGQAETILTFK